MKEVQVTPDEWRRLLDAKYDMAWERYYSPVHSDHTAVFDRYNVTLALIRDCHYVLDIGCGQGLLAHLAAGISTLHVVGIDASEEMVTQARRWGIDAHVMRAEEIQFPDAFTDAVVLGQVLEHVFDAARAASEALRVLATGGRLIVNVPANDTEPHGNHVRTFESVQDLMGLFGDAITWQGWGQMHYFWYAWGNKQ